MDHTLQILLLLLFLFLLHRPTLTSTTTYSPSSSCSDKLDMFSSCLRFIAAFPHNLTDCEDVSAAYGNGSTVCLCYFDLQPKIVKFPINSTKLLSLASVCPLKNQNSKAEISLETLCSGGESPPGTKMGTAQESSGSELPSEISLSSLPSSSATVNINDDAPPMQQSHPDHPPEANFSTTPASNDLSTFPDLRKRSSKSPKPPNPPKTPSPPKPPVPPNPPSSPPGSTSPPVVIIEPPPILPAQAPGPSCQCQCSQSSNLGPLSPSHFPLALLSLYSCFF